MNTCKPDKEKISFPCLGCGDLEEQGDHGHDLGWNIFLISEAMQDEMAVRGMTTIVLTYLAYSSPGNLHYTLVLRDPGFTITDAAAHGQAVALLGEMTGTIGINNTSVQGRVSQRSEMNQLLSQSTTRGTEPYISTLDDCRGNKISTKTREQ